MPDTPTRQQRTAQLQQAIESHARLQAAPETSMFTSGCPAIDQLLPASGLTSGMIVEWLALHPGSAAGLLGLINCREACRLGGMLVVIDRQQNFYPPVARAWGISPHQLLVLHPTTPADHVWALIQALESPAAAAVWTGMDHIDSKTFQRIRLAARTGNTLGVLLRPAAARGHPSWADVQFWVQPLPQPKTHVPVDPCPDHVPTAPLANPACGEQNTNVRPMGRAGLSKILLARCRGAQSGGHAVLEIDATHGTLQAPYRSESSTALRVAPPVATAKNSASRTKT